MKRTKWLVAGLGVALVLAASISPAWSYFTDHSWANGGLKITVKPTTTVEETYGSRVKHLTIANTGDNDVDVFLRARAYASESLDVAGTGWTGPDADGWYIYGASAAEMTAVPCGQTANELTVTITFPEGATENDPYNVIVVYESTPAQYNEDGTTNPDWSYILDRGTEEGSN